MIVGWDFETHLIKPGMVAPRPVCMSFQNGKSPGLVLRSVTGPILAQWFREGHTLVGHNTAYDLVVAMAEWPELVRPIFDAVDEGRARCTFIRQSLLDIAAGEADFRRRWVGVPGAMDIKVTKAGRALDDLVSLYFNEVLPKEDRIRLGYGDLEGLPIDAWPAEFRTYVLRDAVEPTRVFEAQAAHARAMAAQPAMDGVWALEDGEDIPDERPQTRAALWLQLMSSWGMRTDPNAVRALKESHERNQAERKKQLLPTGMIREDGSRDMKVIQARVLAAYGEAAVPRTNPSSKFPEGQIKADTETLVGSRDEALILLGESLSDASTIGTWLPHLEAGTTYPICVGYNPIVDSGRTSARKPNIQNPPRKGKIRSCFVPRNGYWYSACDYDTAELRALAQVCIWLLGRSDLGDALREGLDPHLALAADILGITYPEAVARYEAGDGEVSEARQFSKGANFGYPGGLGPEKFMLYLKGMGIDIDLKTSRQLRDAWFRRWREMRDFFECVSAAIGMEGEGNIQQFGSRRVRGRCGFTQAANTTFQGLVADGAKRAGWALARECYLGDWMHPAEGDYELAIWRAGRPSPLLGSRPVLFMHDEFMLEIPCDDPRMASRAAERQATVQRLSMQACIPDVPIKCGAVLMRRWYKGAKAVRVNGLMVPSRPEVIDGKTTWVADA